MQPFDANVFCAVIGGSQDGDWIERTICGKEASIRKNKDNQKNENIENQGKSCFCFIFIIYFILFCSCLFNRSFNYFVPVYLTDHSIILFLFI